MNRELATLERMCDKAIAAVREEAAANRASDLRFYKDRIKILQERIDRMANNASAHTGIHSAPCWAMVKRLDTYNDVLNITFRY